MIFNYLALGLVYYCITHHYLQIQLKTKGYTGASVLLVSVPGCRKTWRYKMGDIVEDGWPAPYNMHCIYGFF